MGDVVAFDPEDTQVTAGQMVQRRATHPSNTEHDGIIMGHRCPPLKIALDTLCLCVYRLASYTGSRLDGNR
jgi:hypothetical protein